MPKATLREFAKPISRMCYGAITVLALLVGLNKKFVSNGEAILALSATSLTLILTHTYMYVVNRSLQLGRLTTWLEKWEIARGLGWLAVPAFVPVGVIVLSEGGWVADEKVFEVAAWTLVFCLFLLGMLSKRLMGAAWSVAAAVGMAFATLGVILVLIKTGVK